VDSFNDRVCDKEGEFGSGGTRGARLVEDKLEGRLDDDRLGCEDPVGDVGEAPFGPGLLLPLFLPPPRNRPLLQRQNCQQRAFHILTSLSAAGLPGSGPAMSNVP